MSDVLTDEEMGITGGADVLTDEEMEPAKPEIHGAASTAAINALDSTSLFGVPSVIAAKDAVFGEESAKASKTTSDDDPRITPVGRFLRRFSIDELPQFINVLRQEMSVVGPRPLFTLPGEQFDGDSEHRLLVKPGITGLWQVSGRSDLAWADAMRLDLSYVDNCSMTSDLVIIAKTVRSVFERRGAY